MKQLALISGGTSGIGFAAAKALVGKGYTPILGGRSEKKGKQAEKDVPGSLYIPCDVTDPVSVTAFMKQAAKEGDIHSVIVSAGQYKEGLLADTTDTDIQNLFDVNVFGAMRFIRESLPYIKRQKGSIVTVASDAAVQGNIQGSLYSATKGALVAFTRSLALELAVDGIRANAVCPGDVDTPLLEEQLARYGGTREEMAGWYPLGRIAKAEEIGNVIAFLASPEASFITGAIISVDGGLTDW